MPLVDCVTTATDLSTNVYYKELWTSVLSKIQSGKQFCEHCVIALERVLASGSFAGEGASRAPATSATRTAG